MNPVVTLPITLFTRAPSPSYTKLAVAPPLTVVRRFFGVIAIGIRYAHIAGGHVAVGVALGDAIFGDVRQFLAETLHKGGKSSRFGGNKLPASREGIARKH